MNWRDIRRSRTFPETVFSPGVPSPPLALTATAKRLRSHLRKCHHEEACGKSIYLQADSVVHYFAREAEHARQREGRAPAASIPVADRLQLVADAAVQAGAVRIPAGWGRVNILATYRPVGEFSRLAATVFERTLTSTVTTWWSASGV